MWNYRRKCDADVGGHGLHYIYCIYYMVSYKKSSRSGSVRQKRRSLKRKNAKTRKVMRGGRYGQKEYDDKTYDGQIWPEINKPHGHGMMTWNNGDNYIGQWRYGKMSGQGKMVWSDGMSYTGNWRNNKRHGDGSLHYTDGKVAEGKWDDDKPIGQFRVSWPNDARTTTIDAAEVEDFGEADDNNSEAGAV